MEKWREIQRGNFTSIELLAKFLELDEVQSERLQKKPSFKLNLPLRLAKKIQKRTLDDPLLKQFVPLEDATPSPEGFDKDPVKDQRFCTTSKLLHKYSERALLLCTSACAMHCRYCFRQHFPYEKKRGKFEQELALIREDSSLREIILSGGDPLSLSNATLEELLLALDAIPHIERIRFHTRFPIGIPERIEQNFLSLLSRMKKQIWMVIHSNHPNELDDEVLEALKKVQKLGIPLLNQAVLLKGVNDDVSILKKLLTLLVNHGIFPYYLHQFDRVEGAHCFEVSQEVGKKLLQELRAVLPGYAIPSYVQEIAGERSKSLIPFE